MDRQPEVLLLRHGDGGVGLDPLGENPESREKLGLGEVFVDTGGLGARRRVGRGVEGIGIGGHQCGKRGSIGGDEPIHRRTCGDFSAKIYTVRVEFKVFVRGPSGCHKRLREKYPRGKRGRQTDRLSTRLRTTRCWLFCGLFCQLICC